MSSTVVAQGLPESKAIIESLIAAAVKDGIPASRIVLAGFSQGAALSVFTGFQYKERLAGQP